MPKAPSGPRGLIRVRFWIKPETHQRIVALATSRKESVSQAAEMALVNAVQGAANMERFRGAAPLARYLVTVWDGAALSESWNADEVRIDGHDQRVVYLKLTRKQPAHAG